MSEAVLSAAPGTSAQTRRDDRILPVTRVVAAVVVFILSIAWWSLYLHPSETDHRFAWTILPRMTPLLMGAGYGSAVWFYLRVLFGRRWHRVSLGFLPTTVFVWLLAIATVLHWQKFHHGSIGFLLWVWIYALTPLLVPAVWLWNRRHDPGTPDAMDAEVAGTIRSVLVGAGVLLLLVAGVMFVWPAGAISVWPWKLTPLTARTLSAFIALPGVAWLVIAADRRWSAARAMVETVALGLVFLLIGVARAWSDFDHGNPLSYIYVAGLAGTLVGLVALYAFEERAARRTP